MEYFLNRLYGFDETRKENRKYLRFPVSLQAQCHYRPGSTAQECQLVDISEQGLCFELDTHIDIHYEQNVLLSIQHPEKALPITAIAKLHWVKFPSGETPKLRVGSSLLFMDSKEKAALINHSHTMMSIGVAKNSFSSIALSLHYPKSRF